MEVVGGVGYPSGVNSWLWMPFFWLTGGGKEGQQKLEWQSTALSIVTVAVMQLHAQLW
jgi:hypothetical protein